jgi:hypothetical protein
MNMSIGPTIQFNKRDTPKILVFLNTPFRFSYLTLVKGGYIIRINPMAKGILVVPEEKESIKLAEEGIKYPIEIPIAIAENIQRVRYLSRKPSFFRSCAGAQGLADIYL